MVIHSLGMRNDCQYLVAFMAVRCTRNCPYVKCTCKCDMRLLQHWWEQFICGQKALACKTRFSACHTVKPFGHPAVQESKVVDAAVRILWMTYYRNQLQLCLTKHTLKCKICMLSCIRLLLYVTVCYVCLTSWSFTLGMRDTMTEASRLI